jgi:hypothetical protein
LYKRGRFDAVDFFSLDLNHSCYIYETVLTRTTSSRDVVPAKSFVATVGGPVRVDLCQPRGGKEVEVLRNRIHPIS